MTVLFIAKPLSDRGNGVVGALRNEILYLQKRADLALYNIGVKLERDIADNVFEADAYKTIGDLPKPYNAPDLVVFEEVYKLEYMALYRECNRNNIPYVIIPHGCLVGTEQKKKRLKHFAANIMLFNRFIKKAAAVQYLNEQERAASDFKCRKTLIIPNSVEYKERKYDRDSEAFRFIYVGRYDITVKGLDLLTDTFIGMKDWCLKNNVVLELYGPNDGNPDYNSLEARITEADCSDIIHLNGPVYGDEKEKRLQSASVFIQTSRNEGQPMSIIEALSFGLPCVVTYATSFGAYCNQNKCGIGVNFTEKELSNAIKEIYNNKDYFALCGENALKCMKRDFEINAVTDLTLKEYEALKLTSNNVKR